MQAPIEHSVRVHCPDCRSDITGSTADQCPVCGSISVELLTQRLRQGAPLRRGFWRDGSLHFAIPLAMMLFAPFVGFLISIPFREARRPPLAFPCPGMVVIVLLGAAGVYAAARGSHHHRLSRIGAAVTAWLVGLIPTLWVVILAIKAAASGFQ